MNMILICSYLKEIDTISLGYLQTDLFELPIHFFGKYNLTILCRTDKMIQENGYIMTLVDIDAHAPYFTISTASCWGITAAAVSLRRIDK